MERAAWADNSPVHYMTEAHWRACPKTAMRCLIFVCVDENMKGGRRMEGGKTRRCERLLREQPSVVI